jgi:hypothetical protein
MTNGDEDEQDGRDDDYYDYAGDDAVVNNKCRCKTRWDIIGAA